VNRRDGEKITEPAAELSDTKLMALKYLLQKRRAFFYDLMYNNNNIIIGRRNI
jgi:predicted HTH domain antitoxin